MPPPQTAHQHGGQPDVHVGVRGSAHQVGAQQSHRLRQGPAASQGGRPQGADPVQEALLVQVDPVGRGIGGLQFGIIHPESRGRAARRGGPGRQRQHGGAPGQHGTAPPNAARAAAPARGPLPKAGVDTRGLRMKSFVGA